MKRNEIGLLRLKVLLERKRELPFWHRVAYLIPDMIREHPDLEKGLELILSGQDQKFGDRLLNHVKAYMEEDRMPPNNIAATIINLSEDILIGRTPELRAGDYIALQNEFRAHS